MAQLARNESQLLSADALGRQPSDLAQKAAAAAERRISSGGGKVMDALAAAQAAAAAGGPGIDAWAQEVLSSMGVLAGEVRGTGTALSIPLDGLVLRPKKKKGAAATAARLSFGPVDDDDVPLETTAPRRTPSRLDSQWRREEMLKGKEGSRQRRRWENDRLMHVPGAQPPLPIDWEVRPTHPVHYGLPYHLAQHWDKGLRQHVAETRAATAVRRRQQMVAQQSGMATGTQGKKATAASLPAVGLVTRELRATAKKTPAVKSWVRVLEEPVRQYLLTAERARAESEDSHDKEVVQTDSESETALYSDSDDEIVFVGRRPGGPAPASWKRARREVGQQPVDAGIVFDALGDDESASFRRWLTHSISDYYGLASHSASVGTPPRRVVYVTMREDAPAGMMPRPMWEMF